MKFEEWDRLEFELASLVVESNVPLGNAIFTVCINNGRCSAKSLLMAAISLAAHLEEILDTQDDIKDGVTLDRYRIVIGLAADVTVLARNKDLCQDLHQLWHQTDDNTFC